MALKAPDMSQCSPKKKCCEGTNKGIVYDPSDPCDDPNDTFDAATCDCASCYLSGDRLQITVVETAVGSGGDGISCSSKVCGGNPWTDQRTIATPVDRLITSSIATDATGCDLDVITTSGNYGAGQPCTDGYTAGGIVIWTLAIPTTGTPIAVATSSAVAIGTCFPLWTSISWTGHILRNGVEIRSVQGSRTYTPTFAGP